LSILQDVDAGMEPGLVAAKFHVHLAELVWRLAGGLGTRSVACSGGVFQNALLSDILFRLMPPGHGLYLHRELSPNDENISFGQLAYWDHDIDGCRTQGDSQEMKGHSTASAYSSSLKTANHVFGNTRTDKVH
jgi:hydrogenase maturation protein HypF